MARTPNRDFPKSKLSTDNQTICKAFQIRANVSMKNLAVNIEKGDRESIAKSAKMAAKHLKAIVEECYSNQ